MSLKNSLPFLLFSLLLLPNAFARKPAVEDFVGVEPETYSVTGQGAEVLFNFGNTVEAYSPAPPSAWDQWVPLGVLAGFLLLPFCMWFVITRATLPQTAASTETKTAAVPPLPEQGNVANLKDYQNAAKGKSEDGDEEDQDLEQAS